MHQLRFSVIVAAENLGASEARVILTLFILVCSNVVIKSYFRHTMQPREGLK